ncbi:hypothetical protein Acsp01_58380 [Actinoplanes sp. NBRC 101535]|nr:hypothetical protein Acsp01_58380 [Actinoplanes sp. NBRC 101535]
MVMPVRIRFHSCHPEVHRVLISAAVDATPRVSTAWGGIHRYLEPAGVLLVRTVRIHSGAVTSLAPEVSGPRA